jgi:beta-lactamase class D
LKEAGLLLALSAAVVVSAAASHQAQESCFLLYDEQSQKTVREPSGVCATQLTPASTFKIPHALAALDAGVIRDGHERMPYDGSDVPFDSWKGDHDLASAMRDSVVWYFQRIAERLGRDRENTYLKAFEYGNQDASGPLTGFWLGSSLRISPDEQLAFLRRFFEGKLPVRADSAASVREVLRQPEGRVVNAMGEHSFGEPWPPGTTLFAKTGAAADGGRRVTWLVGRVERDGRGWLFVSCVVGSSEPLAAVEQAARQLRTFGVFESSEGKEHWE